MLRGEARRESGVPPDSADPAHALAVARNLAARGVPVDGNGHPPAALTAPLSPEEAHLYQALAPQVARLRAAGKITSGDPTGGFTSAEQALIPQTGGRGIPLAASGQRGVEIPPSAETAPTAPSAPPSTPTASGPAPAAPPLRPWGGLGPDDLGQQIETQRGLRGTLQQLTPKAAIYIGPDGAPYGVDPQEARRAAQSSGVASPPASVTAPIPSGEDAKGALPSASGSSGPNLPSSSNVPEIPGLREALGKSTNPVQRQPEAQTTEQPGQVQAESETDPGEEAYPLKPYREGKGHHLPAKSILTADKNFDQRAAFAIPKDVLERLGIDHTDITTAQQRMYRAFAKTEQTLDWDGVYKIETQALIEAGGSPVASAATAREAIGKLEAAGFKPMKIPWGKTSNAKSKN